MFHQPTREHWLICAMANGMQPTRDFLRRGPCTEGQLLTARSCNFIFSFSLDNSNPEKNIHIYICIYTLVNVYVDLVVFTRIAGTS